MNILQDPEGISLLKSFSDNSALLLAQFALEREEIPYQVRHAESFRAWGGRLFGDESAAPAMELWVRSQDLERAVQVLNEPPSTQSQMESCPACGAPNPSGKSTCPECGLYLG